MIAEELVTLLRYQVDNSGLARFRAGTASAMRMARGLVGTMRGLRTAVRQGLVLGVRDGVAQWRAMRAEQNAVNASAQRLRGTYGGIGRYLKGMVAFFSIRKITSYIDSWGQMEARMRKATASAQEYEAVDKQLARVSRLTYKSYNDNAELFVRVRRTMQDLGKTTQDTVDVTEALSLGMVLSSTKTEDTDNVITQFTKAVMSGKLGLIQYQSLISQAPRLQTALADGLGVTTVQLLEMVKAGKVTTDKMLPALNSQLARMRVEAEDMPVTLTDAFTVLNDAAQRFFGKTLTAGRWAILRTTNAIEYLADHFKDVAKIVAALGAAYGLEKMRVALIALRAAGMSALFPFIRMAALAAGLFLIGEDIAVWMKGGQSVMGDLFGAFDQWADKLEGIRDQLNAVRAWFGDVDGSLQAFLLKWGAIGTVGYALVRIVGVLLTGLRFLLGPVKLLIQGAIFLGSVLFAILGWPALLAAAVAAAAVLIYKYFDEIKDYINGVWESVTKYFTDLWQSAVEKVTGWVKKLFGTDSVLTPEQAAKMRAEEGKKRLDQMYGGIDNLRKAYGGATQQPQSFNQSQNNEIKNQITINAQTNSPAALANAAGAAAGEATQRSLNRGRSGWGTPNVEVSA